MAKEEAPSEQQVWVRLWDEFYALKAETTALNVRLVEQKVRMRTMGMQTPQPAAPRPVPA